MIFRGTRITVFVFGMLSVIVQAFAVRKDEQIIEDTVAEMQTEMLCEYERYGRWQDNTRDKHDNSNAWVFRHGFIFV